MRPVAWARTRASSTGSRTDEPGLTRVSQRDGGAGHLDAGAGSGRHAHGEHARPAHVGALVQREGRRWRHQAEVAQVAAQRRGGRAGRGVLDDPAGRERVAYVEARPGRPGAPGRRSSSPVRPSGRRAPRSRSRGRPAGPAPGPRPPGARHRRTPPVAAGPRRGRPGSSAARAADRPGPPGPAGGPRGARWSAWPWYGRRRAPWSPRPRRPGCPAATGRARADRRGRPRSRSSRARRTAPRPAG